MNLLRQIARLSLCCAAAALAACSTPGPTSRAQSAVQERADFKKHFDAVGTDGTLVIYDVKRDVTHVYNPSRAGAGFVPASTFKIPNSLIAIEAGVARDVDSQTFAYSGQPFLVRGRPFLPPQCNEEVTLRTAFKFSCVPVYQELARRIGMDSYRKAFGDLDYGRADLSGQRVDSFWLDEQGHKVTAEEQVRFLTRFYRGQVPFSRRTQDLVKDIMVTEKEPGYTLRGKTGYLYSTQPEIGWYVGWLERGDEAYVFALNLDITKPEHARARASIVKAGLKDVGAL